MPHVTMAAVILAVWPASAARAENWIHNGDFESEAPKL